MTKFYKPETNQVLTEQDIINLLPSVSFTFNEQFYQEQGLKVIFPSPYPDVKPYQELTLDPLPVLVGEEYHDNWVVADRTFTSEEKALFLSNWKKRLKDSVAAIRYQKETGGYTLNTGILILTDRQSQSQINNVFTSLVNNFVATADFKNSDGTWTTVNLEVMTAISNAVANYVKSCFTSEKAHCDAIDALTAGTSGVLADDFADIEAYDFTVDWPSNIQP